MKKLTLFLTLSLLTLFGTATVVKANADTQLAQESNAPTGEFIVAEEAEAAAEIAEETEAAEAAAEVAEEKAAAEVAEEAAEVAEEKAAEMK